MKEFYYQIKGKSGGDDGYSFSNWAWPPIFSGKVAAANRKEAKILIEKCYDRNFATRVLSKDLMSNEFLLRIQEIKGDDDFIRGLFEVRNCQQCNNAFKIIDKYNDSNCVDKSPNFCCEICKETYRQLEFYKHNEEKVISGKHVPVIYKITYKATGECYIGKTIQPFTLRWYQHFYQGGDTKFHRVIKNSKITDWIFEVVEVVSLPKGIKSFKDADAFIRARETLQMQINNSIDNGFNTLESTKSILSREDDDE